MPGKIVTPEEWLVARKDLLAQEKAALRAHDAVATQLRDFPMVPVTQLFTFEDASGAVTLSDLFGQRKQLVIYHFMLGPDATEGCTSCSFLADHMPNLAHLHSKDTSFVVVSRAPYATIAAFKARMGWTFPWVSSHGSDFNFVFHVSQDESVAPVLYNYKDKDTLVKEGKPYFTKGEQPGMSVFYRDAEGGVFHTYSTYSRGLDSLMNTYTMLDMTPLGRQEKGAMTWTYHDKYDEK